MKMSSYIEKWDSLLYILYNLYTDITCILKYHQLSKILSKNRLLKDSHRGERCFVVMNGPSINLHDLSLLKYESVLCSNFFYRSEAAKQTRPNYYCWADSAIFLEKKKFKNIVGEIRNTCPKTKMIFNYKAFAILGMNEDIYYEYCKHIPNLFAVRSNFRFNVSNFVTVAFHTINVAIEMGFSEIYLLGLDFEPGAFKHFNILGEECEDPKQKIAKEDVCGNYWSYAKAQYESYALNAYAERKGIHIINLNSDSCIRAFRFGNYEELFLHL